MGLKEVIAFIDRRIRVYDEAKEEETDEAGITLLNIFIEDLKKIREHLKSIISDGNPIN